ncbi:MAG: ExbD/TolR family protein [Desulfonatronovibrionaceae bacterium]
MIVHFKKRERYKVQAPLTSLVDIVFLLLIYFLLTTNFMVDEGIKIDLPQAKASAPQAHKELVVYVDSDSRTWIGERQIREQDLYPEVKKSLEKRANKRVIVRADRSLILNRAVHVMDVLKAAGAEKLCLATEKTED